MAVLAAAIAGAGLGSKLLVLLQHPDLFQTLDPRALLAGKSVAGALIGGLVLVECVKRWIGVRRPTGDLYVLPLCLGIALGRVGCFLSGLDDHTYGTATALPWGVDFGDGVRRHPTQLYEIAVLIPIAIWTGRRLRAGVMDGSIFRGFLTAYLGFRIALDFVKPEPRPYLGLTATQIVGTIVIAYLVWVARWQAARAANARSTPDSVPPFAETAGGR